MIDLTKKALPNVVKIGGVPFVVKTDYRHWMRFMISLEHLKPGETIPVGYLFEGECPQHCQIVELLEFAAPSNPLPRQMEASNAKAISYELDGDLIYAAFLAQYGLDLVEVEHLHWHKFLALLSGLEESTKLREVMGYRCYKKTNRKQEEQFERLKYAWAIPEDDDEESQEELDAFNDIFTRKEQGQTEP